MDQLKEKILMLLLGGLALGCARTPGQQRRVFKEMSFQWKRFNKKELTEGIGYLYKLKYIDSDNKITKKGVLKALNCRLDNIKNTKEKWDGLWRVVSFDIPEKYRNGRDALRIKLRKIGFYKLQQSIFITPYKCEEELRDLVKYFKLEKYVRIGTLQWIDNEKDLKDIFKL